MDGAVLPAMEPMPIDTARRRLLSAAVSVPLLTLAACATPVGGYGLDEGVRRLLTLSSQRAFTRLIRPGGFYDDQLTRIVPPDAGGSNDVLGAILRTGAVRNRLAIALNDAAVDAADRATPIVLDAVRTMSFGDALTVLRGGPTAATTLLERQVGGAVVQAMFPEIASGLNSDLSEVLAAAVAARTGVDYRVLATSVAEQAGRGIFRAIGREEAAIRADPRSTRDPVLIALLGAGALTR